MTNTKKLTYSALFLALGLVLPFLSGQIPSIGSLLLPMHIPVLLCGFLLGPPYGLLVGVITPLLRSMLFGMPPFMSAFTMAFELAMYGFTSGLLYAKTKKIYFSLLVAMLAGRIVWGIVNVVILGIEAFPFSAFLAGAFLQAIPGIILQLILIPILVKIFDK